MSDTEFKSYFDDAKHLSDNDELNQPNVPRVHQAFARLKAFRGHGGQWPHITRQKFLRGLNIRINKPDKFDQASQNTCGVMAVLRAWALDNPVDYVEFALALYERGTARLKGGKLAAARQVTPSKALKLEVPPAGMDEADWLVSASIRESLNDIFDYSSSEGIFAIKAWAVPGDVEMALRRFGYSRIRNKASVVFSSQGYDSLMEASELFLERWRVMLFVHQRLLDRDAAPGAIHYPNHWIGLASAIAPVVGARTPTLNGFTVWSWAKKRPVPQFGSTIPLETVTGNYFGFVAGRY